MRNLKHINTLVVIFLLISNLSIGQKNTNKYFQKHFDKNKIFASTFELWFHKNVWFPSAKDTVPYMVDNRDYKGIVNYGVTFHSQDYRVFNFTEDYSMFFLQVQVVSCAYSRKDSIIEIEGYVKGGWGEIAKKGWNKAGNYVDVFIGEVKDTITPLYYKNSFDEKDVVVKLNNKKIENYTVLDTFSSFYFTKYTHLETTSEKKRYFKIKRKINEHSILAFGSRGCYSEIYDIGAMIFSPQKNKKNKIKKQELIKKEIIVKNKLVTDIEKEKQEAKEINYYTYTEKAENYILRRQYTNAKETYLLLAKEYKTLFARDIHNAIRCAILSRDNKNAYYWGEKIADKGIDIKYFDAGIFNHLKKKPDWEKFIARFDSISVESKKRMNLALKLQLEQLVEEDQSDYGLTNRKEPKVLYETTERVTDKLIELLKKEGYPSEEKIGVYTKNDTVLVYSPDYYILIRHAIQQKPKNLLTLNELLNKSIEMLEYDSKRDPNNTFMHNSCFHIYKGNLYNSKACGANDLMVKKMMFMFKNQYNFIISYEKFVITEYDKDNPEEYDKYYNDNFNFIMKLTDDWKFYE